MVGDIAIVILLVVALILAFGPEIREFQDEQRRKREAANAIATVPVTVDESGNRVVECRGSPSSSDVPGKPYPEMAHRFVCDINGCVLDLLDNPSRITNPYI